VKGFEDGFSDNSDLFFSHVISVLASDNLTLVFRVISLLGFGFQC
jgi:hypothetical protein